MKKVEVYGQLSLFDLNINEIKTNDKISKKPILSLKVNDAKKEENCLINKQEIINKYKSTSNLNRIIAYCGGGFGIESLEENAYKTIYVNRYGEEEFTVKNKCPVLPMDKIVLTNCAANYNEIQSQKLIKYKNNFKKVIKRKGDQNIILEKDGQVVSINPKGWLLEFQGNIEYEEDEILEVICKKETNNRTKIFKPGDKVIVNFDDLECNGTVRSKHSIYDAYSIDFEKQGLMCNTTFHISQILRG